MIPIRKFDRSNQLYLRAIESIPLGSQTFSKSVINCVAGVSPLFLDRGDGAYVWDPDGNRYIDFVIGLMPMILGYRDPDVDRAIKGQIEKGVLFSLPSTIEMELAEKLINIVPSAEMVRFGKNGSDVTSAAVRLARAHTGRDRIAVCGYHGWHDWYIGTTSRNKGVPEVIRDLSATFSFNDPNTLEDLLKHDPDGFAGVILEPEGVTSPAPGFLQDVRDLSYKYGSVLIFDEIISGFRAALGGAQQKYNVTPDLTTLGKALGNGMPISALVGSKKIMSLMTEIFFSGTYGGECLSIAASIETLTKLQKINAPGIFQNVADRLVQKLRLSIDSSALNEYLKVSGTDWWPRLSISQHSKALPIEITSLLRQELIKNGILMGAGLNLCVAHADDDILSQTEHGFSRSVNTLAEYLESDRPVSHLQGEMIKPVFSVRA